MMHWREGAIEIQVIDHWLCITMAISYVPEPHERAYYEGLFQAADVKKTNNIGGQEAVQFLSRSKLPVDVLKNIWTVADQPSTSSLDRLKFAVAIRLIQLTQNGTKGQGPHLAVPPGVTLRPAFLEAVSGVSVPLPQAPGAPSPAPQAPPSPQQPQQQMQMQQQQMQQQQMQQMQAPPTPNSTRSGFSSVISTAATSVAPGPNNALVTHDPYSMTPQERGRYEDLFPQFAKPDGFVYGKEAVDLFMKSGVNAQALRELWGLVDRPVDNRLDKLEFAIAMHLIVCISKKNLPPPTGQLPPSLTALKNALKNPAPPTPSLPPLPPLQQQQQPSPQQQQQLSQQPTLAPPGGMSISDAFEGLSVTSGDPMGAPAASAAGGPTPLTGMAAPSAFTAPTLPSYVPAEQQPRVLSPPTTNAAAMVPETVQPSMSPAMMMTQPPAPFAAEPPPPSTQQLAANYNMGDESEELGKLKNVLQKLQAENISLKAQLGTMTQEEKDVQKELSATVAEIGNLSNQLQGLRSEVLGAKTNLLEASAQLKAAQQQKSVLADLIGEATETKATINDATASMQNVAASNVHHQHQQQVDRHAQNAIQKNATFESNMFGYDNGAPASGSMPPPSLSFDSEAMPDQQAPLSHSFDVSMMNQPPSSPQPNFPDIGLVSTISSDDELPKLQGADPYAAAVMFENESAAPAPVALGPSPMPPPAAAQQAPPPQSQPVEMPTPQPAPQYQQAPPPGGQPQSMGIPTPNPAQQYQQMPPPAAQQYQQMPPEAQQPLPTPQPPQQYMQRSASPIATPQYGLSRPMAVADHNRKESVGGFGGDFVMGGSAPPLGGGGVYSAAAAATQAVESSEHPAELAVVEELKSKARVAQETANDAAAAHIKLAQEADELRGDADKAEASSRSLRAASDEKRKGRFGAAGKKKQMNRDADSAADTATDLRKRFMAVQAQAHDAQVLAMQTKREAEKLNEDAEKAEMVMASAASMRDHEAAQEKQAQESAAPNGYAPQQAAAYGGGYPHAAPAAYGYPPAAAYGQPPAGYGQPAPAGYGAPPANGYGYGQPPADPQYNNPYAMPPQGAEAGGYAQPGMTGGAPVPGGGDPYANPF